MELLQTKNHMRYILIGPEDEFICSSIHGEPCSYGLLEDSPILAIMFPICSDKIPKAA